MKEAGLFPWDGWWVYQIFDKKQSRRLVHLRRYGSDTERTTKSLARYLLEVKLGRVFSADEEVDHIDGDKTNDSISNLQVISRSEHVAKTNKTKKTTPSNFIEVACDVCKLIFKIKKWKYDDRLKRSKRVCCSKRCGYVSVSMSVHENYQKSSLKLNGDTIKHGTRYAYNYYGCRCDPCASLMRRVRKDYNERVKARKKD